MNLLEFDAAIAKHIAAMDLSVPVFSDNERTRPESEWVRATVIQGDGVLDESTGIRTVSGSSVLHAFIVNFQVFTPVHTGTAQSNEICQQILNHWQVQRLATDCYLLAGNIIRIGEDKPHYQQNVQIPGRREEFLTVRPL